MKTHIKVTDSLSFEIEADTEDDTFKSIARVQEVFNNSTCGKCKSSNTHYMCRHDSKDNDWLEVVCKDCRAKIIFGRTKKNGQIYPKVKWSQLSEKQQEQRANEEAYADKHYGYLPDNGWFLYKKLE